MALAVCAKAPLAAIASEAARSVFAGRVRGRVEFMVSSGIDANLAAVQQRVVPIAYLSLGDGSPLPPRQATVAQVLRMKPSPEPQLTKIGTGDALLTPYAGLPLLPPANEDIQRVARLSVAAREPVSAPQMLRPDQVTPVRLIQPEPLHLVPLGDAQTL